jgi:hypothetical protein
VVLDTEPTRTTRTHPTRDRAGGAPLIAGRAIPDTCTHSDTTGGNHATTPTDDDHHHPARAHHPATPPDRERTTIRTCPATHQGETRLVTRRAPRHHRRWRGRYPRGPPPLINHSDARARRPGIALGTEPRVLDG